MLKINDTLPKFEIQTDNIAFKMIEHYGKNIVIFFFPRADTSGCTAESIAFSNLQKNFDNANCIVIGISKDDPKKQLKFREKYNLTCKLGADFENNVCEQFSYLPLMPMQIQQIYLSLHLILIVYFLLLHLFLNL